MLHLQAEREDDGTHVMVLPEKFSCRLVRQDAKDTCTNWFYKIGAIPDLLPRIYLEMAIVRCMYFLQDEPPINVFTVRDHRPAPLLPCSGARREGA